MALINVDYFSAALMRTVTLDVILPFDRTNDAMAMDHQLRSNPNPQPTDPYPYPPARTQFKTLYLLHGLLGNHADWVSQSGIRTLAEERGFAVVMPSGYNAFYLDQPESHNYYGRFVGQELVRATRAMFPLSARREDTFLGGISMGGYGALRNGLKYCESFGGIMALSSAMVADNVESIVNDGVFFLSRPFLESVFGPLNQVMGSDKDPARLAADLVYCDRPRPRVFSTCGSQDPLAVGNRALADRLRAAGLDVTYEERDGQHDWNFWNHAVVRALDWMGL